MQHRNVVELFSFNSEPDSSLPVKLSGRKLAFSSGSVPNRRRPILGATDVMCRTLLGVPMVFVAALCLAVSISASALAATLAVDPPAGSEMRKTATWNWPDVNMYLEQLSSYLDQAEADDDIRSQVEDHWRASAAATRGPELLDRLMTAAALIEPRIATLNSQLSSSTAGAVQPGELEWLTSDVPGWMQDTIRLACGRALAQRRLYDEALEALAGLDVAQVCDPASLVFYRATCEHHLMQQDECIKNIDLLLERESELPTRFSQVANLMRADIEPLKEDSLDEVARLMRDVERRLDLGRAGTRVRDEEQEIVEKLDKLIEQIEEQMQQQQQQSQSGQGTPSQGQANPMDDSRVAGGSGPGDVDNKETGDRSGWGNLPQAQRQESLQRLTEDLPSHYRQVIEGYFRQLAKEK